jgi:hypothetical protein
MLGARVHSHQRPLHARTPFRQVREAFAANAGYAASSDVVFIVAAQTPTLDAKNADFGPTLWGRYSCEMIRADQHASSGFMGHPPRHPGIGKNNKKTPPS